MASNLKVDIVKPTATNGSLSLKGDSSGSATTNGISVDSSGDTSITGTTTISTADINGGNIDGTTIGGTTPAAGSFTDMAFNSGYGSVATAYGCRAWVNFRGTTQSGTATASGLVSGQYTATVTSATQFTVVYSGTTYTINTSGNHEIGDGEGVDLTVSGTTVTIDTQIRASGNVSSITDNGTGDYTVNFTTAMPDANYSVVATGQDLQFNNFDMGIVAPRRSVLNSAYQTSSIRIGTSNQSGGFTGIDFLYVNVAIFR